MVDSDAVESAVQDGETLRFHGVTRDGGHVGVTDERLFVEQDELTAVPITDVESISVQSLDWFVAVLSVALVGFGVYSIPRNTFVALAFTGVGVASVLRTYRRRNEVLVRIRNRPKPLRFYPLDVDTFQTAAAATLESVSDEHRDVDGQTTD